jgi:hypothetical protein
VALLSHQVHYIAATRTKTKKETNNKDNTENQPKMPPSFGETVEQLRGKYQVLRDRADIFAPRGRKLQDMHVERVERFVFWYGSGPEAGTCIRVVDRPGTLSGDILRLRQSMPAIHGSFEVDGDQVYPIPYVPPVPDPVDDTDDLSSTMAHLPLIQPDPEKRHIKKVRYKSGVLNLLRCQGWVLSESAQVLAY